MIGIFASALVLSGNTYKEEVLSDSPSHLWMLDDGAGSTQAVDIATGTAYPMVVQGATGLTFGSPTLGTGGTSVQVAAGSDQWLNASAATGGITRAVASFTAEAVVQSSASPLWVVGEAGSFELFYQGSAASRRFTMKVHTGWVSAVQKSTLDGVATGASPVHVALVYDHDASKARLYVNGSLVLDEACARTGGSNGYGVPSIGARNDGVYKGIAASTAAVALYPTALSAPRILAHAQAAGVA